MCLSAVRISSLSLIWILCALVCARRPKFTAVIEELFEEDKFINTYGNNSETSGLWESIRKISNQTEKLKIICTQAHEIFFGGTPVIETIGFYTKQLHFPNFPQYQPMKLDVLVYTAKNRYQPPTDKLYNFHVAKGLSPDCIYYVVPTNDEQTLVKLQEHVCGLKFPL